MFASTFRTQARLALTSCRARVSMVSASRTMLQPRAVPTLSTSRALSTSRPLWDFGSPDAAPARGNQPKNILFVGNMPYSVEEREIREKFEPFGEIQSIRIAYRPDGASRGFAHVEFVNEADAAAAVESTTEEPVYMLDRDLRVSFAERKPRPTETRTPTHSLYFHGLRADPEVLRNATRPFENSIINLFFLKDRETGKETGAGFIHFMSVERATEALHELNGLDLVEIGAEGRDVQAEEDLVVVVAGVTAMAAGIVEEAAMVAVGPGRVTGDSSLNNWIPSFFGTQKLFTYIVASTRNV
ncbi:hypothetical protein FPV67DRAFT_1782364 [Lyophyllum atratum]|nr:hypothetical protein FPV67DRAFT_1782364 [Lyophyllum atratum]